MRQPSNEQEQNFARAMNAEIPLRTDSYTPVPHSDFLQLIAQEIENSSYGLQIKARKIYTNLNGQKLVGFYSVGIRGVDTAPEFGLEMMLGYKNSYDKSMSAGLAAGLNVTICENGVVAGDMLSFRRKHTGEIRSELREHIQTAIINMRDGFDRLVLEVDIMKDYGLTLKQKAELMGIMYFEENMVTPNQLSIVKKEMNESENFKGDTLWDLYNNVTQALKTSHPLNHIEDHIKLHSFMRSVVGINPELPGVIEVDFEEVVEETVDQSGSTEG